MMGRRDRVDAPSYLLWRRSRRDLRQHDCHRSSVPVAFLERDVERARLLEAELVAELRGILHDTCRNHAAPTISGRRRELDVTVGQQRRREVRLATGDLRARTDELVDLLRGLLRADRLRVGTVLDDHERGHQRDRGLLDSLGAATSSARDEQAPGQRAKRSYRWIPRELTRPHPSSGVAPADHPRSVRRSRCERKLRSTHEPMACRTIERAGWWRVEPGLMFRCPAACAAPGAARPLSSRRAIAGTRRPSAAAGDPWRRARGSATSSSARGRAR